MAGKVKKNPLSRAGLCFTICFILFTLGTVLTGFEYIFEKVALPLTFCAAVFFTVWLVFQYQTGEISLVTSSGTRVTYRKREEPVWFFFVFGTGLITGIFLTAALGSDLFLGCEWSMINSCQMHDRAG